MVHRCCISSCGMNVRVPEARGLSYHTFPLKEPQRLKWIAAIVPYMDKPKFKVVQGYTRICSRHFTKKDYSLDSRKRARLSSNAVPSVFPEKGAPVVTENTNLISDFSSNDDIEKDLPAKVSKCGSGHEIIAAVVTERVIATQAQNEEIVKLAVQAADTKIDSTESRDNTRRRKIKKNRTSKRKSTSPARDVRRTISTNSANSVEELNIEHVGEAFADIKLSKLLMGPPAATEPLLATPKDWKLDRTGNAFRNQQQLLGSSAGSVDSLCSSTDDNNSATPVSTSLPKASDSFGSAESNIEPELVLSIQAVNLNSLKQEHMLGGTATMSEQCTSSESESDRLPVKDFEESLLETLTLNEFSLMDNKLPFDMSTSLLHAENFSILDDDEYHVFSSPLQSPFNFDFNSEDTLITEFQNMSAKSDELSPIKKSKQTHQEPLALASGSLDQSLLLCESNDDHLVVTDSHDDGRLSPAGNETKKRKTARSSFSVERFLQSESDIEYYTGFHSYSKFEAFFNQIQTFSSNFKVNFETKKVDDNVSTSKDTSLLPSCSTQNESGLAATFEGISPSQGALSHIDELFLTIIRLRRRIPDKILGHMFCISRPAVTRTVRSWTALLTKILEKSTSNQQKEPEEDTNETNDDSSKVKEVEIPHSVRRLLESGVARSILTNARSAGLSRKTSCNPSYHSTSKSKRLKKEKSSSHSVDHSSSGPTSPAGNPVPQISQVGTDVQEEGTDVDSKCNGTNSLQEQDLPDEVKEKAGA